MYCKPTYKNSLDPNESSRMFSLLLSLLYRQSSVFKDPKGITADLNNRILIIDEHQVKRIWDDGTVTILAGSSSKGDLDGYGTNAKFNNPKGITKNIDNYFYLVDTDNHKIKKIDLNGIVTTFAGSGINSFQDGNGTNASFNFPSGITSDASGNLFVADTGNYRIRKISLDGTVTTIAGNGNSTQVDGLLLSVGFSYPTGITIDSNSNIYLLDSHKVLVLNSTNVSTFAGSSMSGDLDGTGLNSQFSYPSSITSDSNNHLYITDYGNYKIKKITSTREVSTIAGNSNQSSIDGVKMNASFSAPTCIFKNLNDILYVCDYDSLRMINSDGIVSTMLLVNRN
jgi:hypothetical protein